MPTPTKHHAQALLKHVPRAMLKQCSTNVTNVLTYKLLTLNSNLTLSNARRGVARFRPSRNENSPAADAPRGLRSVIA